MKLELIDVIIIVGYLVLTIAPGFYFSKKASKDLQAYFLGSKTIPWWILGISNASGMFDITGTMWLVSMCFVYGLKSAWLPWIWPTFNQIFLMVYLSVWLRRSNVMTGAEWLEKRFGNGKGAELSQLVVVIFALVSVVGFIAYTFKGIGKFSQTFLPWDLAPDTYALILIGFTSLYVIKGGMYSVVITELIQFVIMTIASVAVGVIAMNLVSPEMLAEHIPEGWGNVFFGSHLDLDWTGIINDVNNKISEDGFSWFSFFVMMMIFKGVLVSMAGPVPNYDMQRILATKTAKDAAKMSGLVSLVMYFPRYMLVTGLTILAIVFLGPKINTETSFDFEMILPYSINNFIPVGFLGLLLAGLIAAFMSTYAATVNAAPVYFVNDIYKKYIKPDGSRKLYVRASYIASLVIIVLGISFGFVIDSINSVTQWVFGALFGGYTAANLLKWYWWRFNGFGYFCGMMAGLVASLLLPFLFPDVQPLYAFPFILITSLIVAIGGSLLTKSDNEDTLIDFYKNVRPWGWWGPVKQLTMQRYPDFKPNDNAGRDTFNIVIGVVWQFTLVVMPIYLVVRELWPMLIAFSIFAVTSVILKKNWLDKLEND
ncbi:Na+:solute symporter [Fulvivirga sp. 29W222]|uniref:Na+:solute symporter n=1 Tax=Fulvivirga marina TaxID=2494733 RepID=A0A937FW50_9BACT|nr:sodium:solute symporter family protein [Fulvivirga marina]MBL6445470.1 Na+:solute symporter [Fulvivirga marina]